MTKKHNFLWIDTETAGLNPGAHKLLEVAVAVVNDGVDGDFKVYDSLQAVIRWTKEEAQTNADDVVLRMHEKNGLWDECESDGTPLKKCERAIREFIGDYAGAYQPVFSAGSSVHFDVGFLRVWMPNVSRLLHHRVLDTRSLVMAYEAWSGREFLPEPRTTHRALADIEATIKDAAHLRTLFDTGVSL